ncbi:MAG: hypothetical protein R6U17_08020 [Thermoplasmata archaeon]
MLRKPDKIMETYSWKDLESDIEGASTIGSLILLISAVLVSSIVAGVLINTVSTLREQAHKTGQDAVNQVSTGVNWVSIIGDRNKNSNASNPTSGDIQVLEIMIELRAGSDPINIDDMMIQIDNGDSYAELSFNASGTDASDASASEFIVVTLRDPEGTMEDRNVMSQGTLVKVIIRLDSDALNMELGPSTQSNMMMMPRNGNPTQITFTTPSVYMSRYVKIK